MIQDIHPHSYHVEYTPTAPASEDYVLFFRNRMLYVHEDNTFYTVKDLQNTLENEALLQDLCYLFQIDETSYYLIRNTDRLFAEDGTSCLLSDAKAVRLSEIRYLSEDMVQAFAGYTAAHLALWYDDNRFCGHCGAEMVDGTDERKRVCPVCGREVFPRINPAVIVAVHDGDRLLMTKYAGRSVTWFVLVAGFTEIGESAEETVRREVLEETGIHVKNIHYFGSQPWGIPGNLTLGYTAELDGSDQIILDTSELAEGAWIKRDEVPVPNDSLSITAEMIRAFKEGRY